MKQIYSRTALSGLLIFAQISIALAQQAVSSVVTDYNGFWKSSSTSVNPLKPQNSHNLLAFTYKSVQYSTGVNDGLLSSRGESFTPGDFWCLPIANISGTINSNTKIGLGQLYDGVNNGASNPAPDGDIVTYLTDGVKGLNIGTCIANLPAGTLSFFVSNIKPANIGDGIPDILVTQVADPSNSYDRYAFTSADGQVIGQTKDVVFTNITPVANWTADFYEASQHPITLTSGFTNTDRPMRLWAADLSDFGINASNYDSIARFRITLSGNSDVAFAAYNNRTFTINSNVLPVSWSSFTGKLVQEKARLNWATASEQNSHWFVIEKSSDRRNFVAVDSVPAAGNSESRKSYQWQDPRKTEAVCFFRIRLVNRDKSHSYSQIITLKGTTAEMALSAYPNPAHEILTLQHPAGSNGQIQLTDMSGRLLIRQQVVAGSRSTSLSIQRLPKGLYQIAFQSDEGSRSIRVLKQ
jgi:hypothetical protein